MLEPHVDDVLLLGDEFVHEFVAACEQLDCVFAAAVVGDLLLDEFDLLLAVDLVVLLVQFVVELFVFTFEMQVVLS